MKKLLPKTFPQAYMVAFVILGGVRGLLFGETISMLLCFLLASQAWIIEEIRKK